VIDKAQRMIARNHLWLGDEGVAQILSAGPVAISEKLQNLLSVALGLTAQPLNAPAEVSIAAPIEALRSALEVLPESLNLTEARKRKFSMNRRSITLTALASILLIQLIAWPILYAQAPKAAQSKWNRELREVKKETAQLQKTKTEIRQMRDELNNLEELSKDQLSMMQVLKMVSDGLPEDSYLSRIQFSKEGDLKLSGLSKNVSALSGTLLTLPFVKDIIKSDSNERSNSEYSSFNINFTVKDMAHE
jgi:Tfp pilus assembly protein PilN